MTGRLTPLRAAVVALAALAGLFAMHGLTHHGEHLPSHDAHHAVGHALTTPLAVAPPATMPISTELGGATATMCLAILLTGLLVRSALRRPARGLLVRPARVPVLADRPRPTSRSHDPPSRWSLSVCRC